MASATAAWLAADSGLVAGIAQALAQRGTHAARCVVLLPNAQLLGVAQAMWAQARPDGFAPRFETTRTWAQNLGGWPLAVDDIRWDAAHDILTAQSLLQRAGLRAQAAVHDRWLLELAQQLAPLAAAVPPGARLAWGEQASRAAAQDMDAPALALEAAISALAVAWAASSSYAADRLWQWLADSDASQDLDLLLVVQAAQADPLASALLARVGARGQLLAMPGPGAPGRLAVHAARDGEDEAARAAACVLQHLAAGRAPVALVAADRALARRVRAMLGARGLAIRDESGWKLSTTRAAARAMGALRAAAWDASTDSVLDWAKHAPAFDAAQLQALEHALRHKGLRWWRDAPAALAASQHHAAAACAAELAELLAALRESRPLGSWLSAWRNLLLAGGQWEALQADEAGQAVVEALHLDSARQQVFERSSARAGQPQRRLSLAAFAAWSNGVLEAANYVPAAPPREQVSIVPLGHVPARPFAALVMPGCDEQRLVAMPEGPGHWSRAQREALGLPSREDLAAAQRAAWASALAVPAVDVLWRAADDGGEPLLPSPLLQLRMLDDEAGAEAADATDPRVSRHIEATVPLPPLPRAPQLVPAQLSASAYADLRRCPYRFFALRQLGLAEADELDSEVGKRDFGSWVHLVLKLFHEALAKAPTDDPARRLALIETAALQARRDEVLPDDEFLPFAAAWPQLRDDYLVWLAAHEGEGARFVAAELSQRQTLGVCQLVGRLDRLDRTAAGGHLVIDYKTESETRIRERVRDPAEDTQLAFYAALRSEEGLRAAYLGLGERGGCKLHELIDVGFWRDALCRSIAHDLERIEAGAALPALGEGPSCENCAARGLCRKDFWA